MATLADRKDVPIRLIGSWTTSIGPIQDQAGIFYCYMIYVYCTHFDVLYPPVLVVFMHVGHCRALEYTTCMNKGCVIVENFNKRQLYFLVK